MTPALKYIATLRIAIAGFYGASAKNMGLQIHRRMMSFVRGYVSCNNCACNYSAQDETPVFCQIYGIAINPLELENNINRGENCVQCVGRGMDRNEVVHPNHYYRYEKWDT